MTLSAPMRCSALAEQLDEPIAGTIDQRRRWLLLEDRSAWGTDAVKDLFGTDAAALAKRLSLRLLLIRRHEGDPAADAVRRAFLVDTATGEAAVRLVHGPVDLSVEVAATNRVAEFGDPVQEPFFLVCTNGKRDACCALRGRAVVTALSDSHAGRLWECTHLGGHRFAGNLVCLPDGIVYGRVPAEAAPGLVDDYLAGRVDPRFMRGRSAWPAPAQVAEVELRARIGMVGLAEVTLESVELDDARASVVLGAGGTSHRLDLVAERSSPRSTSCRADELEEPVHWRVA